MELEVLYTSKTLDIEYNREYNYLYCNWKGFQTVDSVKGGGNKILELFRQRRCRKVLNDNRLVTGPWQGAAEWAAKEWFPAMYGAGLKHFAWVVSPSISGQLSIEKTLSEAEMKDEITCTFDSFESAHKWLVVAGTH